MAGSNLGYGLKKKEKLKIILSVFFFSSYLSFLL